MNKYQEAPSLLEVRQWKEQCNQENSQLTQTEYLEKLRQIAQMIDTQYYLNLPTEKQSATLHQS
ncbi:hypothetical protein BGP_5142 [Beggiatoa sp. PS]|nr:hypothetical protein BGP_5142 [Beggiatoa sp. PS]